MRVLVVEDEEEVRSTIAEILHDEGHQVIEVDCGLKALTALKYESPDIVLLDLLMPDKTLDGFAVLRELEYQEHPPIVVMTAVGGEKNLAWVRMYGAVDVLHKPFDIADLFAVLKEHMPHAH